MRKVHWDKNQKSWILGKYCKGTKLPLPQPSFQKHWLKVNAPLPAEKRDVVENRAGGSKLLGMHFSEFKIHILCVWEIVSDVTRLDLAGEAQKKMSTEAHCLIIIS